MQYSANLVSGFVAYGGNPVSTGPVGSFSITFTGAGDQTATWNKHMFFKASAP
jgi:hypothetical protein